MGQRFPQALHRRRNQALKKALNSVLALWTGTPQVLEKKSTNSEPAN
jgi:hypothetical protein